MNKMSYEAWAALSRSEQEATPDELLPEIPQEMLTNKLTKSVCKRMEGEIGWETTQTMQNGSNTRWFPQYQQKPLGEQMLWYQLDPTSGLYSMMIEKEQTLEEAPIGVYGMRWMAFMEEQHPDLVELMQTRQQYLTVARSVDSEAETYQELLYQQYEQMEPRPETFEEILAWEKQRQFYTESAVMREKVLVPITTP